MESFKFGLFLIVTFSLAGILGYWSVTTLQSGAEHSTLQKVERLEKENENLKQEAEELKSALSLLQREAEDNQQAEPEIAQPETKQPAPATVSKNQALINELQKLINDNIFLKLKSSGTRVGTAQKFLNIYNKTSNRVDNDYGASTQTAITAFQKAEGLTADGEAGPGTFKKMIDWLKKQG
ncbi:hypothetical protein A2814_03170 [Candidatus Nomurabacteria bacterium RIFCSPHIGHO2_01_FULL_38_19]|uniref:Peptidoglycan binding-like domain-containing protein n=1 Tax=Candidatus Nomurabacteria bacterium RIFCSPHIGHO2_01_FULL_38_19 TaxID=1801732 RepID=A0A1F6UQ86_9BACT|nr:MAG: hypothetical protein A2814_03170 [Candidatus Nomurabacteria bacterium RIFCSPHIGHO2_01_FULL_38_19]